MQFNPMTVEFNTLRMGSRKGSVAVFNYQSLEDATNNFNESNVLSEDGSGLLYRASFDDKLIAAVKKVNSEGPDSDREFKVSSS